MENTEKKITAIVRVDTLNQIAINETLDHEWKAFSKKDTPFIHRLINDIINKYIGKSEEGEEQLGRKNALHFAKIVLQGMITEKKTVAEFSPKLSSAKEFLHEICGFTDLEKWLFAQGKLTERIIRESGMAGEYLIVKNLRLSSRAKNNFEKYADLKSTVADMSDWFKLVSFLITNENLATRTTLQRMVAQNFVWSKVHVCATFLLALSLDRERKFFGSNDIVDFLKLVNADYEKWKKSIIKKAEKSGNERVVYLVNNPQFVEYMEKLANPEERTIIFFKDKIVMDLVSERKVKEFSKIFDSAVRIDLRNPIQNKDLQKKVINELFITKNPKSVIKFLRGHTELLRFVTEELALRIIPYDTENSLIKKSSVLNAPLSPEFIKIEESLNHTYTGREVIRKLWDERQPFGIVPAMITKFRLKNGTDIDPKVVRQAYSEISRFMTFDEFKVFLADKDSQNIPKDMALHLFFEEVTSENIMEALSEWSAWIDDNLRKLYIKKKK